MITRRAASHQCCPSSTTWIICDTGSTDGTQDIIRNFFAEHGKPGELHEQPSERLRPRIAARRYRFHGPAPISH